MLATRVVMLSHCTATLSWGPLREGERESEKWAMLELIFVLAVIDLLTKVLLVSEGLHYAKLTLVHVSNKAHILVSEIKLPLFCAPVFTTPHTLWKLRR